MQDGHLEGIKAAYENCIDDAIIGSSRCYNNYTVFYCAAYEDENLQADTAVQKLKKEK